jgi:hypothetical protein
MDTYEIYPINFNKKNIWISLQICKINVIKINFYSIYIDSKKRLHYK